VLVARQNGRLSGNHMTVSWVMQSVCTDLRDRDFGDFCISKGEGSREMSCSYRIELFLKEIFEKVNLFRPITLATSPGITDLPCEFVRAVKYLAKIWFLCRALQSFSNLCTGAA
jgi:hypothetical protein